MGSCDFWTTAKGKTARDAFSNARDQAFYDHGHGGYTGTIAEKSSFDLIPVPAGETPQAFAERLMNQDDPRISDKWGPAGCVALGDEEWLFFGYAST